MSAYPVTDSIVIRAMRDQDLESVRQIDRMSFSMPWPDSAYSYELHENPLSSLWVAEDTNFGVHHKVIGMIVVWFIIDEAHIATLAVHPEHRGKGIATRLLSTALEQALEKGMQVATLEVRAQNTAAQEIYRRFGFEIVGHRPRYYRDNNEDAIIMTVKPLSKSIFTQRESDRHQIANQNIESPSFHSDVV
jgi:ribosomal-protein-alanine N-acetyltransferase